MKKIIGFIFIIMALVLVSGCDADSILSALSEGASNVAGDNSSTGDELGYDSDDVEAIFGNNYKVVFTYTDNTESETITEIATEEGFLIQSSSSSPSSSSISLMYVKSGDTSYTYCTYDETQEKWVAALNVESTSAEASFSTYEGLYMSALFCGYEHYDNGNLERVGTETIVGISCTKYRFASTVLNLTSTDITYWVADNGLCLKVSGSVTVDNETSSYTYEVTELKIGGNSLPTYDASGTPTLSDGFPSSTVLADFYLSGFSIAGIANATDVMSYSDEDSLTISIEMSMTESEIVAVFNSVYNKGYSKQYNESETLVTFIITDLYSNIDGVYDYSGYYQIDSSSNAEMAITYSAGYLYMTVTLH